MTAILYIGAIVALAVLGILVKAVAGGPKKAEKWEKADIMKQILALSENENGATPIAPMVTRTALPTPGRRAAQLPTKSKRKNRQSLRSHK